MKQVVVDGDIPFLPEEIIRSILKRLPVKSLIRFQCVCKHWKNLIKSTSFIADHLHHSSQQNPYLLFQRNPRADPLELYLLDCEMHVREVLNAPLIGNLLCGKIISSSNGLLCVERDHNGICPPSLLLWNPAIRAIRQVPRTVNDFKGYCVLGFGFSPIVNDYKIVRTYAKSGGVVNRVEVFSISIGSWKEMEFGHLEGVSLYPETVTTNGTTFWHGLKRGVKEEGEDDIDLIVSFDIAREMFTLIPWPAFHRNSFARFTVYENKLAILFHSRIGLIDDFRDFRYSLIDLWVMEEGIGASEEKWSWSKKYTCSPYPCWLHPGTIWENEIVCNAFRMCGHISKTEHAENDEQKSGLFLFNVITNEFRTFASRRCDRSLYTFNYVESLVPVRNINIEEY